MVYYRKDLLAKDNLKPPATWDDYITNRQEVPGPGPQRRRPARLRLVHRAEEGRPELLVDHLHRGRAAPEPGHNQGRLNTKDMSPLVNNDAFAKALDMYKQTKDVGPPDQTNMDVGGNPRTVQDGRCALSMDWGDIGTLVPGTYAQDKTGATITPGWKEVLDRDTGKLVRATRRPARRPSTA